VRLYVNLRAVTGFSAQTPSSRGCDASRGRDVLAVGWCVQGTTIARFVSTREVRMSDITQHAVAQGHVSPGFEPVRDAFADNFRRRHELGGACCVYHRGERVVDLWGGVRHERTAEPWEADTMVLVHSSTKGLAAMTLALAHSRGWLDYDEPVCGYWPEFAQHGKEHITVRQLLAHQAGLFALDVPIDRALVADLDRLATVLARQTPAWEPGTRQGYHAITLGFYESQLLRRVDPRHRSLGTFFQEDIATPLGLDAYIRLPESIPDARLATLARPGLREMSRGFGPRFMLAAMNPHSKINRSLRGSELPNDHERIYARNLEVPSGGAVATARAIARAYSVFASGGHDLGLRRETLDLLAAPATPPVRGFRDVCLGGDVQFSLGFMKPSAVWPFGTPASFGSPGAGGSLGFADPVNQVGYAYVTNRMGTTLTGDPRDVALRSALYAVLDNEAAGGWASIRRTGIPA
jgi:CubicO group peptidase (beta-lactamase class C family)